MNINPVGPLRTNLQSSDLTTAKPTGPLTPGQSTDAVTLSPAASLLHELTQLQQYNSSQFGQTVTQISDGVKQAAQNASNMGDSAKAGQLNHLATTLQKAAAGGPLPTAQQLQQAGLTGHAHHGGHHLGDTRVKYQIPNAPDPTPNSGPAFVLNSIVHTQKS
ncbi:MAG TPA: hypothetical protein VH157_03525 [Bryobacteraceae bacterium]|nr:hypothetical protein [Bryobacteraceae bacterium]